VYDWAVVAVGWMAAFGVAAAVAARRIERPTVAWLAFGAVLGPIALLLLHNAPPGRCRTCGTPTRGWSWVCWWCREDVRSRSASTVAMEARMAGRATIPIQHPGPLPNGQREVTKTFVLQVNPTQSLEATLAGPRGPATQDATSPTPKTAATPAAAATSAPAATATPVAPVVPTRNGTARPAAVSAPQARDRPGDGLAVLATAVFVAGSSRLKPGHRYGLALESTRFLILGPTDVDPLAVVLDRAVADIDVQAVEGRLLVSEPRSGSGLALAFMSVAGATTGDLAARIANAARATRSVP
jgi:hypothetical protein